MSLISLVIPLLNEADNLLPLQNQLIPLLSTLGVDWEIIFVDDGSTDGSLARLKELHAQNPKIKVLALSRNFGHQLALTAGMDAAAGDACILMDADLQHPPEVIREMVALWREGYEIVYSVRKSTGGIGLFKRASQSLFYRLFRRLSGVELAANTADFRLLDRKVLLAFSEIRERVRFLRGLTEWVGFRSKAITYDASPRLKGTSKYSVWKMLRLGIDGLTSFSAFPLYLAAYFGVLLTLVSMCYVPYAAYIRFVSHHAVPGWASLMTVICAVGGLQMMLLGVLGVYIAKIYEEVKQRPLYLVREALGLTRKS